MMKRFKVLFAALALVTTFGMVSCDSNDDPRPETPEVSQPIAHPIVDPVEIL